MISRQYFDIPSMICPWAWSLNAPCTNIITEHHRFLILTRTSYITVQQKIAQILLNHKTDLLLQSEKYNCACDPALTIEISDVEADDSGNGAAAVRGKGGNVRNCSIHPRLIILANASIFAKDN
jgi:hypothetical protein